ncbi:MAG: cytidine deaminase [Lachnospiraceae bacterium]|nr:cytidine deaminase [Lachnospiraceae bacterium]
MTDKELVSLALKAREMSYSPYSNFAVGAALLTKSGKVYLGCNIENAGYTPTNCAERTAFFKAVSEGEREFSKIAIVGGKVGEMIEKFAYPCGVCRQVMREFCDVETFEVISALNEDVYQKNLLKELLPYGFGPENL